GIDQPAAAAEINLPRRADTVRGGGIRAANEGNRAPADQPALDGASRAARRDDQLRALLAVSAGGFSAPDFAANSEAEADIAGLRRREILVAALIPGRFPEARLIGQIVFVMHRAITILRRPDEAFVEPFAVTHDRTRADHRRRGEFA